MRVLYNRIICCVFAVLMLFSGMCVNDNKADIIFSSTPVHHATAVIDSFDKEITENRSCTIDMLGIRSISSAISVEKRSNFKMDTRMSTVLFCADLFAHNISVFRAVTDTTELPDLYYKTAVLSYIQSIDGKK